MQVMKTPPAPVAIRVVSWILALLTAGSIVWLVFNFGYYASGLAAVKQDERTRRQTPIRTEFADPNKNDPNSP